MNWPGGMSLCAPLLIALILNDLVPVRAQTAAADAAGDPYHTQSPVLFNVLQGENFSIMLNAGQTTSTPPSLTSYTDSATQDGGRIQDSATTMLATTHQISAPLSDASSSPSVGLPSMPVGNATANGSTTTATCATAEIGTTMPLTTTRNTTNGPSTIGGNSTSAPANKSTSYSAGVTSAAMSSSAMTDGFLPVTPNKPIASLRASGDAVVNPRTVKRTAPVNTTTGRVSLSVKIRSSDTKEEAIRKFSRKICDLILNTLRLEDVGLTLGPDRTQIMCLDVDDDVDV